MRTRRMTMCAGVLLGVALVAGCGDDGEARKAGPASVPEPAERDDGPRLPPALERGEKSPEARMVAVLERAKLVRVLRLSPDAADCRTANCIQGNAVTAAVVLTDETAAWRAADLVDAWLAKAESVEPTCDPTFRHAVVLQGGGHEHALLLDTRCGAYQLVVDGHAEAKGQVETPEQIGVLEELLLAGEMNDGLVDGGEADAPAEDEAPDTGEAVDEEAAPEETPDETAAETTTDA